jgi:hypothetical protein
LHCRTDKPLHRTAGPQESGARRIIKKIKPKFPVKGLPDQYRKGIIALLMKYKRWLHIVKREGRL